ncbi:MAG: hypothetical protein KA191_17705 [Verrucomicrobia bacterium]|jgi:hypothetical protein|nr:hypothetical protein [Verrucomicrobiota bacterium]OQC65915.1 MAG: hypothetical protein BWX48_02045 [Verrucomicrobia bacterium ADurb.Bin006]MDI9381334.1 hypothetical protein [Verrucomicrobiota bacterium]NMD21308.1 glycoside hydrolase family 5 protein [Verrucomicrobiota bacterium]HOA62962.1 hypothetical protein [Verrucomicrobiota bacterium]
MKQINQLAGATLAAATLFLGTPAHGALNLNVSNGALKNGATPFVFVAYNTYGMVAEGSIAGIEQTFDSNAFFDQASSVGRGQKPITGVRVWLQFHWANAYTPFKGLPRSASDTNRRNRFDFTLNTAFFDRLERFVAAADAHNIAVQLCLFDGCALEIDAERRLRWENCPYNQVNNRDSRAISRRADFFKNAGPLWEVNRALVDHTLSRLGRYGNVIWEIMNEPDVSDTGATEDAVLQFHRAVATRLRAGLRNAGGSKVITVNPGRRTLKDWALNSGDVDMLSAHLAYDTDVGTHSFTQYLGKKPCIVSNDGHKSCFPDMGCDQDPNRQHAGQARPGRRWSARRRAASPRVSGQRHGA